MKKLTLLTIILTLLLVLTGNSGCKSDTKEKLRTVSFDEGWRFLKDNPAGAENPDFNDSNWRIVDLPHDWSIEDLARSDTGQYCQVLFPKPQSVKWVQATR